MGAGIQRWWRDEPVGPADLRAPDPTPKPPKEASPSFTPVHVDLDEIRATLRTYVWYCPVCDGYFVDCHYWHGIILT